MQKVGLSLLFVVLAGIGYWSARWLVAGSGDAQDMVVDCDLSIAECEAQLDDGTSVRLSISPRPVPLMEPLAVQVMTGSDTWTPVHLDITGLNMEMGLNRTLIRHKQQNVWGGETILPICSQRRMHWQAALWMDSAQGPVRLLYQFYTLRP